MFVACHLKKLVVLDGVRVSSSERSVAEEEYMERVCAFNDEVDSVCKQNEQVCRVDRSLCLRFKLLRRLRRVASPQNYFLVWPVCNVTLNFHNVTFYHELVDAVELMENLYGDMLTPPPPPPPPSSFFSPGLCRTLWEAITPTHLCIIVHLMNTTRVPSRLF